MHQFKVTSSDAEILVGDRLVPLVNLEQQRWIPHPTPAVWGRVAAVLKGAKWASLNDIVAINRGLRQGLDTGSVVAVVRHVKIYSQANQPAPNASMPDEIATLLIFDVSDEAALAVVMRARDTFTIGDTIESVDRDVR
jgi:ABC-type thiamin/hydroxymethylpyrimidine transport system permease subunit